MKEIQDLIIYLSYHIYKELNKVENLVELINNEFFTFKII